MKSPQSGTKFGTKSSRARPESGQRVRHAPPSWRAGAAAASRAEAALPSREALPARPLQSLVEAVPRVLHRTPKPNRDAIEMAELRRRQEWLEGNGYHVALEDILDNLKQELGYVRDLSRQWHNRTVA